MVVLLGRIFVLDDTVFGRSKLLLLLLLLLLLTGKGVVFAVFGLEELITCSDLILLYLNLDLDLGEDGAVCFLFIVVVVVVVVVVGGGVVVLVSLVVCCTSSSAFCCLISGAKVLFPRGPTLESL